MNYKETSEAMLIAKEIASLERQHFRLSLEHAAIMSMHRRPAELSIKLSELNQELEFVSAKLKILHKMNEELAF